MDGNKGSAGAISTTLPEFRIVEASGFSYLSVQKSSLTSVVLVYPDRSTVPLLPFA